MPSAPSPKIQALIRIPIWVKLAGLLAIVLLGALSALSWLSTRLFIDDTSALIQQMNADAATNYANQVREKLQFTAEKVRTLGRALLRTPRVTQNELLEEDVGVLAVFLRGIGSDGELKTLGRALSSEASRIPDAEWDAKLEALGKAPDLSWSEAELGEPQVSRFNAFDGRPALVLVLPFVKVGERFTHLLVGIVKQSEFEEIFADAGGLTGYLVSRQGLLLAHQNAVRATLIHSVASSPIVRLFLDGRSGNAQTRYRDPQTGESMLGAYHAVGFAGMAVVAEVPEARAHAAARHVQYRASLLALIVLCISFALGQLFSGSISRPIRELTKAAVRISRGNFKVRIRPRGRDEIAYLSHTFNSMAVGLEERDRVKAVFNKFHSQEIADKILSGDLKLGGEKREALIFFSDVRGFTALSEEMSPEGVVEMMNEYISRMVPIIRRNGGVVDKYIGDSIMALWGVPIARSRDIENAIRACLEMRIELDRLNQEREQRHAPPLRIGMGLNHGYVVAGNFGSPERMEYTVIGDAVNLASRIESKTKDYGTDLLVPRPIVDAVRKSFLFEKCGSAKVKGKTDPVELYRVVGYCDEKGKAVRVETPYSSYPAEKEKAAA